MATVIVAGMGPADVDYLPSNVQSLSREHLTFIRTRSHPAAKIFAHAESFDRIYDEAETLEHVYVNIAERLVEAAILNGSVLYLVPGSPLIAERTVELLRLEDRISVRIEPAISFLDLAWARLGIDPVEVGATLVDGHRFTSEIKNVVGSVLVAQCDSQFVLSDIKLSLDSDVSPNVTVLQRLGLNDESVFDVEWDNLDRSFEPDHLTSLWIPSVPATAVGGSVRSLYSIVQTLRAECPWDRSQTHGSLAEYVLEEANEVAEVLLLIDAGETSTASLVEELGDLLFQVLLHAAIGEEESTFTLVEIIEELRKKMVRRHPHVFDRNPDEKMPDLDELQIQWTAIKAQERK